MTLYLGPGGYFWGRSEEPVSTILGSCVSLIAWLPEKQSMLVSHVMLPTAPLGEEGSLRYGDACWLVGNPMWSSCQLAREIFSLLWLGEARSSIQPASIR